MSETVYLKNGQKAELIKIVEDGLYIVDPYVIYYQWEGEEEEDIGERTVVDAIFREPPQESVDDDYIQAIKAVARKNEELAELQGEIYKAKQELTHIKNQKTDFKKGFINKSELKSAETIAVFVEDKIEPWLLSDKIKKELKISITISVINGEEKSWAYRLYNGDTWSTSYYIDQEYGYYCDINEKELIAIAKERAMKGFQNKKFGDYTINNTADKYLPNELLEIKKKHLEDVKMKNIEELRAEIDKNKNKLRELQKELDIVG